MPPFQFEHEQRAKWERRAGASVSAATAALRAKMAAALGTGAAPLNAEDVYDSGWWDEAIDDHVAGEFHDIARESATMFAADIDQDLDDDRLTKLVGAAAAVGVLLIASRSEVVQNRVSELVERSAEKGWDALRLADELGVSKPDQSGPISEAVSANIGVTAATTLVGTSVNNVIEDAGLDGTMTWNCLFHNSRDSHIRADGQTVNVGEMFQLDGGPARYPGDPDLPVEEVVNCVIEGTKVRADAVRLAFRRRYVGNVVELRTRSGKSLTVTPNHPLLTDHGWVPAGELDPLVHCLYRLAGEDIDEASLRGDPDPHGEPVEQFFASALGLGPSERMVGVSVDFHGDGTDSDVEVARSARLLRTNLVAALPESEREFLLVDADEILDRLAAECSTRQLVVAGSVCSSSDMSWDHDGGVSLLTGDGSGGSSTDGDPRFNESSLDGEPRGADRRGDGEHGLAGLVAVDEIVNIEIRAYDGHVFNLSTASEWYGANGIVSHNCNCWLTYEVKAGAIEAATEAAEAEADEGDILEPDFEDEPAIAASAGALVLDEILTEAESCIDFTVTGGGFDDVVFREAVEPEWGLHGVRVGGQGGVVWRPSDGGIEGLSAELGQPLVDLARLIADQRGVVPPSFVVPPDEIVYSVRSLLRSRVVGIFGGPGSGPRPGYKRDRGVKALTSGGIASPKDTARAASAKLPEYAAAKKAAAAEWLAEHPKPTDNDAVREWYQTMPPDLGTWIAPGVNGGAGAKFVDPNPRVVAAAKALATKNFTATWDDYGGKREVTPEGVATLTEAVNVVGAEPKMQAAAERFGKISNWVPLGDNARASGVYIPEQDAIGIVVGPRSLQRVADRSDVEPTFGGLAVSSSDPIRGTIRHEFGHHVDRQMKDRFPDEHFAIRNELQRLGAGAFNPVSKYAGGTLVDLGPAAQEKETFAELFAAVTSPAYDRAVFPDELHPVLEKMEGLVV